MKLPQVDGYILLATLVFALIAMYCWTSYLNRAENLLDLESFDFKIACSDIKMAGKSYLYLIVNNEEYSSGRRIEKCESLASTHFNKVAFVVRKDQDVIFDLKFDEKSIYTFSESTDGFAQYWLVLFIFSPVIGLWVDQYRKRPNGSDL